MGIAGPVLSFLGPVVGWLFGRLGLGDEQVKIFMSAWRAAQNRTLISVTIAESEGDAMIELEQRRKAIRDAAALKPPGETI